MRKGLAHKRPSVNVNILLFFSLSLFIPEYNMKKNPRDSFLSLDLEDFISEKIIIMFIIHSPPSPTPG